MKPSLEYRKKILNQILSEIKNVNEVLAVWEGGSTATGTADEYSDIDLCILTTSSQTEILNLIEASLQTFGVSHVWQPTKSFWGEGLLQRVIVLSNAPKYFSVDVGVFSSSDPNLLKDFLEVERHGTPFVYFDRANLIVPGHCDPQEFFNRQQKRVEEIFRAFPIFKTLTLKEIDRGHAIDAIGFYQNGMLRPLIEVMGMLYRPFKFDFGMRYIHKTFPPEMQDKIQELNYVKNLEDLSKKVSMLESLFLDSVNMVRARTKI